MTKENDQQRGAGLSEETEKLLRDYIAAFANFYGILPLYRALRIIRTQNPDLELSEEEFIDFTDKVSQEEHYYIIAGEEEIYCDVNEPTPPLKREIITEHLYAVDDFESYEELKAQQEDKPYYIPEKEELLKYKDDGYIADTKESIALGAFMRDKLKMKRADDILSDLQAEASLGYTSPNDVFYTITRLTGKRRIGTMEETREFFKYYADMCNNMRLASNRGFTPNELHERMGGPPRRDIAGVDIPLPWQPGMLSGLNRASQKKPGRNDPCPCGSGKKYKRCCGR